MAAAKNGDHEHQLEVTLKLVTTREAGEGTESLPELERGTGGSSYTIQRANGRPDVVSSNFGKILSY